MLPLATLTRRGLAVLATHHPTKGEPPLGQAARGSGALLGHVGISIEMRHPGGNPLTRQRRLPFEDWCSISTRRAPRQETVPNRVNRHDSPQVSV